MEKVNLKADVPSDFDTAFTGSRVSLAKGDRLAVIVNFGDSTAAVVTASFQQHTAASGGTSKALSIANIYFHKVGAATSFTKVEPTVAASSVDLAALLAAEPGIVVFEILAEDLDVSNNFTHVSINFADTTAAKLGSVVYLNHQVKAKPAYEIAL